MCRTLAVPVALSWLSGVATAQPVLPSVVAEAPGVFRAAGSFVLVLLFGGVLVYRYRDLVDESVDASMDRPHLAVVYGLLAFGFVVFAGGYALSQLARLGVDGTTLALVGTSAVGAVTLTLAGLGFVVVGTLLTGVEGRRRPWYGLILGAGISSVGWLVLPALGGLLAWVVLASFGIGGRTREWFHPPRRVEPGASE